jgi:hypothetical protein
LKFTFQSVSVTDEKKPGAKQGYQKAVVIYTYNGEPRKQTIVSFSNPAIFKTVTQELQQGQEIEVNVTKNAGGFNEWQSISTDGEKLPQLGEKAPATNSTKVVGSNYESREERAARQVLIVKQSCLAQAVESLKGSATELSVENILERAEQFVEWVFADPSDTTNDIPF